MIPNDNSHVILFLSKMYIIKNWVEKNVKNSNFWRNKKKKPGNVVWSLGIFFLNGFLSISSMYTHIGPNVKHQGGR